MKKVFAKILYSIAFPFIAFSILLDESRRINETGAWDKYWEKQNRKAMKKRAK